MLLFMINQCADLGYKMYNLNNRKCTYGLWVMVEVFKNDKKKKRKEFIYNC